MGDFLEEKYLELSTRASLPPSQSSRNDLRVVHDQQVPRLEPCGMITKLRVFQLMGLSLVNQQAGSISGTIDGFLGDQFARKVEIELVGS